MTTKLVFYVSECEPAERRRGVSGGRGGVPTGGRAGGRATAGSTYERKENHVAVVVGGAGAIAAVVVEEGGAGEEEAEGEELELDERERKNLCRPGRHHQGKEKRAKNTQNKWGGQISLVSFRNFVVPFLSFSVFFLGSRWSFLVVEKRERERERDELGG